MSQEQKINKVKTKKFKLRKRLVKHLIKSNLPFVTNPLRFFVPYIKRILDDHKRK